MELDDIKQAVLFLSLCSPVKDINDIFTLKDSTVVMEIMTLQTGLVLKSRSRDKDF